MKDNSFQRSQDNSSGIDHRLINESSFVADAKEGEEADAKEGEEADAKENQVYVRPTRRAYHLLALEFSRLGNWRLADRAQRAAYAEARREMSVDWKLIGQIRDPENRSFDVLTRQEYRRLEYRYFRKGDLTLASRARHQAQHVNRFIQEIRK